MLNCFVNGWIDLVLSQAIKGVPPIVSCTASVVDVIKEHLKIITDFDPSKPDVYPLVKIFWSYAKAVLECSKVEIPELTVIEWLADFIHSLVTEKDLPGTECAQAFAESMPYTFPIRAVTSSDPNDKVGSLGVGESHYLATDVPLRYAIFFENLDTATAPAQEVIVTDPLNPQNLDLSTLSLGPITIGEKVVIPPSGQTTFITDVDLRPDKNMIVRISVAFISATNALSWQFISIDPATGLPVTDPTSGFLPPNTLANAPKGSGSVVFTVMPKKGLATETQFTNLAHIVFDTNAPIDTPVWLNTLDNTKPISQVAGLSSTQSSTSFVVNWAGTDTGSGVKDYTIYVSEDNGSYSVWLSNTTAISGTFTGQTGKTYSFYSIAQDQVGNLEDSKINAEATTRIVLNMSPIANAGANQTVTTGAMVTLDGTKSNDPDNGPSPLTYSWVQTSGPAVSLTGGNTATPSFVATQAGTYEFSLLVSDGVANNSASVVIAVNQKTIVGDLNGDGTVTCADLAIVKASFGKRTGQSGFDPRADVNNDSVVDVRDLSVVSRLLSAGTKCP